MFSYSTRRTSVILNYLFTTKPVPSNLVKTSISLFNKKKHFHSTMSQPLVSGPVTTTSDYSVYVQSNPSKDMITISFSYSTEGKTRQYNLYRKTEEPLYSSLERIKLNLYKVNKQVGKNKKMKLEERTKDTSDTNVSLTINGKDVDPKKVTNIEAWVDGAVLDLNGQAYNVVTNHPHVDSLKLPSCLMKNYIIMPLVSLSNCEIETSKFSWFRQISSQEREALVGNNQVDESSIHLDPKGYWYEVSNDISYSPNEDDVAHYLKITCFPTDGVKLGLSQSLIGERPVEIGPSECPFDKRHKLTPRLTSEDNIRVVTYNILADLYADSDYSRTVLFRYCPPHVLDIDYRRQLLLKELLGYNADLICLQEVDRKEFERTYKPFFKRVANHSGLFNTKGGQVAEGPATFFHNDKFELVDSHATLLSELIESLDTIKKSKNHGVPSEAEDSEKDEDVSTSAHFILKDRTSEEAQKCLSKFNELRSLIISKEELKNRFLARHTVLQVTLLRAKTSKNFVLAANTHLYFAPDADHIRLLQGSVCVRYLEYIKDFYEKKLVSELEYKPHINVILCGDMNSTPDCGLYSLLTTGEVPHDVPDWLSNKEEAVEGVTIKTHLKFKSSYGNIPYTNYTKDFSGCLDYIYYDHEGISCESTIPLPNHRDVSAIGGIPSDVFPSDHLALIANLKYRYR